VNSLRSQQMVKFFSESGALVKVMAGAAVEAVRNRGVSVEVMGKYGICLAR